MDTTTPTPIAGGVLLGAKTFRCTEGHELKGSQPFKFTLPIGQPVNGRQQVAMSGPVCPLCLLDWMGRTFPLTERLDDA